MLWLPSFRLLLYSRHGLDFHRVDQVQLAAVAAEAGADGVFSVGAIARVGIDVPFASVLWAANANDLAARGVVVAMDLAVLMVAAGPGLQLCR